MLIHFSTDTWGIAHIKAAVMAVPAWSKTFDWGGPGVATENWSTMGHSNGGKS